MFYLNIELLDFIRFLETKAVTQKMELAIASESSLKSDWLKHEEKEAWKELKLKDIDIQRKLIHDFRPFGLYQHIKLKKLEIIPASHCIFY